VAGLNTGLLRLAFALDALHAHYFRTPAPPCAGMGIVVLLRSRANDLSLMRALLEARWFEITLEVNKNIFQYYLSSSKGGGGRWQTEKESKCRLT